MRSAQSLLLLLTLAAAPAAAARTRRPQKKRDRKSIARRLEGIFTEFDQTATEPDGFMVDGEAVTKLHGAVKMKFLCAQRGARVFLNISAKFWRISD